jgi:hypothetical protein
MARIDTDEEDRRFQLETRQGPDIRVREERSPQWERYAFEDVSTMRWRNDECGFGEPERLTSATDSSESVHTTPANDAHWVINLSYRDQHRLADG